MVGPHWIRSERTLQALNSTACESGVDLVGNDRRIGQRVRQWIVDELVDGRQSNVTRHDALKKK